MLPYGGEIEHAKAKPMAQQMTLNQWLGSSLWLLFIGVMLYLLLPQALQQVTVQQWLLALVFSVLGITHMYRLLKRRLQGYTGDGLGATQQITEIAIYAGLAANFTG